MGQIVVSGEVKEVVNYIMRYTERHSDNIVALVFERISLYDVASFHIQANRWSIRVLCPPARDQDFLRPFHCIVICIVSARNNYNPREYIHFPAMTLSFSQCDCDETI